MLIDNVIYKQRIVDGVTYSYDITRNKWLSIGTCCISYGINHRNVNASRWMAITKGIYSNNIGFKMPKNGTIVRAVLQSKNQTSCKFIIKDENLINILELDLDNEIDRVMELNTDYAEGISLGCFLSIVDNYKIDFPFVVLECACRL